MQAHLLHGTKTNGMNSKQNPFKKYRMGGGRLIMPRHSGVILQEYLKKNKPGVKTPLDALIKRRKNDFYLKTLQK